MSLKDKVKELTADDKKKRMALTIIKLLTRREYNQWIKRLSKCSSPEEQEETTMKYFKKIGKYDQLKEHVRIIS